MEIYLVLLCVCFYTLTYIKNISSKEHNTRQQKRWYIGRVPPSSFEYPTLNGFYSPKEAQQICEKNLQCAGFTFKGTKKASSFVPEILFFHYIDLNAPYITTEIKYPHWTTYIVGSRDYVVLLGSYDSSSCDVGRIISE